jgi:hypothetical protein
MTRSLHGSRYLGRLLWPFQGSVPFCTIPGARGLAPGYPLSAPPGLNVPEGSAPRRGREQPRASEAHPGVAEVKRMRALKGRQKCVKEQVGPPHSKNDFLE